MWVFGYGSLMWDNWEQSRDCRRKKIAALRGYERIFNKASKKNWGTTNNPGPTLNVVPNKSASCRGMAFEFPEERRQEILKYLCDREKGFDLLELPVKFCVSSCVKAVVPLYKGKDILKKTIEELIDMVLVASGSSGYCVDYVLNLEKKLRSLGIHDRTVTTFAEGVREKRNAQHPDGADRCCCHGFCL